MPDHLPPVTYELTLSEADDAAWQVTRLWLHETLGAPYRAIIDTLTSAEAADTEALLGCDASLTLSHGVGQPRVLHGVVSRVEVLGFVDHELSVRLRVVPALELLGQGRHSRIWQDLSVQRIVTEVLEAGLGDYGRSFGLGGVTRGSSARDYCVQYRESDLDFVTRLLEEEGISFEFVHDPDAGVELLTLRDANDQYGELENLDQTAEIPIILSNPSEADVESIQRFEWALELTPTSVLGRDFDWHTPRDLVSASVGEPDARGRERRLYRHGERRFITDDLQARTKDGHLAAALRSRVARGSSNVSVMRPGLRFHLRGHDHAELEQEYLLTAVIHTGAEAHNAGSGEASQAYTNDFECVPMTATLRPPRRTAKPREHGPQTAIVTGPEGEEIHTDEHGRIQVQFYWQEHPSYAASSSCWVRCSQAWAGMGWGAQFIPRVGMEVVVEFLEGDPDRPLVTGCVYNAEHPPPFALPEHKTRSGWRSESSPGGGGANELRFEDAKDKEEIFLHGEKDWTIEIENDKRQWVGHDESLRVSHDRSKTVEHDETWSIVHDQSGTVGNDQTLSVGNNQQNTIAVNRVDAIGVNAVETVGAVKTVTVGAAMTTTVGATMTVGVGEDATTTIAGDASSSVGGDASVTISGDLAVEATNASLTTSEDASLNSSGKLQVDVSKAAAVKGEDEIVVEASKKMVFKCGDASITLEPGGKITIKGSDIKVKGSGNVVIKGQQVSEN